MFTDANRTGTTRINADVAIVGSGACGLTMARHLVRAGASVVVIETGGFERTTEAERLNAAELTGSLQVWISSRSRFLGGSTNCWGGNNSPLDPVDFERDWIPGASWPLHLDDLDRHRDEVHDLLHLGPTDFSVDFWRNRLPRVDDGLLCDGSNRVITKLVQRTEVGHLGQVLERDIDGDDRFSVVLNGQVVSLNTSPSGEQVTSLTVSSLDRSRAITVHADSFVLAAGPENPRLLLAGDGTRAVGNHHDQVGRWWIAHHSALRGWIEPAPDLDWHLYDLAPRPIGERRVFGALQVAPEVQREERLLNTAAILEPYQPLKSFDTYAALRAHAQSRMGRRVEPLSPPSLSLGIARSATVDVFHALSREASRRIDRHRSQPNRISVRNWSEQAPDPDNRVTLGAARDRFGVPVMQIRSELGPTDRRSLTRGFEILAEEFESFGHGRWVADFASTDQWPSGAINTAHFMGGTRMSVHPEDGVVDPNCRVHGVDNLWVAGGSVFPTAGVSMVTYTAILLALRTAESITASAAGRVPVGVTSAGVDGSLAAPTTNHVDLTAPAPEPSPDFASPAPPVIGANASTALPSADAPVDEAPSPPMMPPTA